MELNDRLYELRKNNNWSQEELAEKLDVSRQTISKWESNKAIPELEKLIKLSEIYNITLDELVKGEITEDVLKENPGKKFQKLKSFLKKHWKKILIISSIIILLSLILFFINITRRLSIIYDFSKYYKERFQAIGDTKSGTVTEHIINRDLNKFEETYKQYMYYVSNEDEKLLKITEFEDEYYKKVLEEIYIDFQNIDDNGLIDNVIKINKKTGIREIVNDYNFVSPIYKTTRSLNNYYSIICAHDKIFSDNEMAYDFDNKLLKNNNNYIWENKSINKSKDNIMTYFNENEFYIDFENYKDDIKEECEVINYQIYNTLVPDREQVIAPEI